MDERITVRNNAYKYADINALMAAALGAVLTSESSFSEPLENVQRAWKHASLAARRIEEYCQIVNNESGETHD